jgi:hypothetical protein
MPILAKHSQRQVFGTAKQRSERSDKDASPIALSFSEAWILATGTSLSEVQSRACIVTVQPHSHRSSTHSLSSERACQVNMSRNLQKSRHALRGGIMIAYNSFARFCSMLEIYCDLKCTYKKVIQVRRCNLSSLGNTKRIIVV